MQRVKFECEICDYKTGRRAECALKAWRRHLLEDEHQRRSRRRQFTEEDKQRSLVVSGIRELQAEEVLWFFSENNIVTDFIFWKDRPDFCLVEFLFKSAGEQAAELIQSILGNEVVIRLRNELSEIEWNSICSVESASSANEAEDNPRQKATTADSDNEDHEEIKNSDWKSQAEITELSQIALISISSPSNSYRNDFFSINCQTGYIPPTEMNPPPNKSRIECGRNTTILPTRNDSCDSSEDDDDNQSILVPTAASVSLPPTQTGIKKINQSEWTKPRRNVTIAPSEFFREERLRVGNMELRKLLIYDLPSWWLQTVQEFNLLTWENLFGIELYELSSDIIGTWSWKNKEVFHDLVGILVEPSKIEGWTQEFLEEGWTMESDKMFNAAQLAYLECLKEGRRMKPKPLKEFSSLSHLVDRHRLTFDLRIFRQGFPAGNPNCVLRFRNVRGSLSQMRMIVAMYTKLFSEFCVWKLSN